MINFSQAFDLAWERMNIILFRPFDLGKWFTIGFSAFLAGFLHGGNGVSFNGNIPTNSNRSFSASYNVGQNPTLNFNQFNSSISHAIAGVQFGVLLFFFAIIFVAVLVVILLIYWLGARGEFMFLDNIVRNRGAIAWPWRRYARQANSLFGFYLLLILVSIALFLPIVIAALIDIVPGLQSHHFGVPNIVVLVGLGILYLGLVVVLGLLLFLFRELGIPIMFRQGLLARPAFWATIELIKRHPGSIAVLVLLRFALFLGLAVVSVLVCCGTCCLGALPYLGSVALLPALIYIKCFTLDCLAQFGPEYNVWIVDVPPPGDLSAGLTLNPPPPPG